MPAASPGLPLILFAFALTIGLLVFVHELGHYLAARAFGIRADRFSIGFGREIAGWTDRRGTRWTLGWLPLGGFVQFAGDADASSRPARRDAWAGEADEAEEPRHWLQYRPVGQRAAVVAAGPLTNFLFAILILSGFALALGNPVVPARVQAVAPQSAAAAMGVRPGDLILKFDEEPVDGFEEVQRLTSLRPGEPVVLTVRRGGAELSLSGRIGARVLVDRYGNRHRIGQLGVLSAPGERQPVSLIEAPAVGTRQATAIVRYIWDSLGRIADGTISARELGGPLKIAQVSGEQMQAGWADYIWFVALISINLGFINLLPIPVLDGGHLLLYAVEAVRGRPAGERAQEWAFRAGLAAVVAFMLFVTFNDLASFGLFRR